MRGKAKALGLALMATLALSAALASTASAEFTSSSHTTTLTATALNTQTITIPGGGVTTCTEVEFHDGTLGTSQTEITVEPTLVGHCTLTLEGLGTLTARIDSNKCHLTFTTHPAEPFHISCKTEGATQVEDTAKILGTFRKCIDIPEQTPTNPAVDFINGTNAATGKMDFEVISTATGITYEGTGSCAFLGSHNDASYVGSITVTGHNSASEPVDVTKSNGT